MRNLLFICFVFLCGCVSQNVYLPNQSFLSPETAGTFGKGSVGFGLFKQTRITVVENTTTNPPIDTVSFSECSTDDADCLLYMIGLNAQVGLISGLNFTYKSGEFGLQYQFLGDSKSEGLKSSIYFGYGSSGSEKNKDSADNSKSDTKYTAPAFSLGYRFSPTFLAYLSYSPISASTKTTVNVSSNRYEYDDTGKHDRGSLGAQFGSNNGYILLEGTYSKTTWSRTTDSREGVTLGGALGVHF